MDPVESRLHALLDATRAVVEQLDLGEVLQRITQAAVDLVGSRYGALGVISPEGGLEQFVQVGMSADEVQAIGHLPEGHGLLGALIQDPRPIRLTHMALDPRAAGFPAHHPPMQAFLGAPIIVRGEPYGNLYLTNPDAGTFDEQDEELLVALATTAAVAVDNARLFGETQRRQRWSAASAEVTTVLLQGDTARSLALVASRITELAEADLVCLVGSAPGDGIVIEGAWGADAAARVGVELGGAAGAAARSLASRAPLLLDHTPGTDAAASAGGPMMFVPVESNRGARELITVSRAHGRGRFSQADLQMAVDFAAKASVAMELGRSRRERERLTLLEDRSRIARDLHDTVIQRLFATGLQLQTLAGMSEDLALREAVLSQVDTLDAAIRDIRTAVFTLQVESARQGPTLRHRILDVVTEATRGSGSPPRLVFSGALDLLIPSDMVEDILAVVREGLANVARHAAAENTVVTVTADGHRAAVEVADDGRGPGGSRRASGIANLATRAERWGGGSVLDAGPERGSVLRWWAPLPGTEAHE